MKDRLKNIEQMETILNRTDMLINELEILLKKKPTRFHETDELLRQQKMAK